MPKSVRPDVPEALDAICRKAMAFEKADRYATCLEVQADIESYLAELAERPSIRGVVQQMETIFAEPRAARRKIIDEQLKTANVSSTPLAELLSPSADILPLLPALNTHSSTPVGGSRTDSGVTQGGGSGAHSGDFTSPMSGRSGGSAVIFTSSTPTGEPPLAKARRSRAPVVSALMFLGVLAVGAVLGAKYLVKSPSSDTLGKVAPIESDRPLNGEPPVIPPKVAPSAAATEPAAPKEPPAPKEVAAALTTPPVNRAATRWTAPPAKTPTPTPPASPAPTPSPPAATAHPQESPGLLSFNTYPWTKVSENGKPLGTTPLFKVALSPGTHVFTLENSESNVRTTYSVSVKSGESMNRSLDLSK